MDKKESVEEPSEDIIRESLIALSYISPDLTSPKSRAGEKVVQPHIHDVDEKYRSELISISSSPPPEVKVLPVVPGQPDA
ncbi:hypothetical protein ACS0TY_019777 [Phlomoides rotata]